MSMKTNHGLHEHTHSKLRMRLKMPLAAATVAVLLASTFAQPAMAVEADPLPVSVVEELTTVWTQHGVDSEIQSALLDKIESGGVLDSMTEASPVSTSSEDSSTENSTVNTFADGSISVVTVAKPKDADQGGSARAINDCGGGGTSNTYTNCSIWGWFGLIRLSFYGSYYLAQGNARITAYNTPVKSHPITIFASDPTFEVIRLQQSGTNAARLNLLTNWSTIAGSGGTTRLVLNVVNFSATTN